MVKWQFWFTLVFGVIVGAILAAQVILERTGPLTKAVVVKVCGPSEADITHDGKVDIQDLSKFASWIPLK